MRWISKQLPHYVWEDDTWYNEQNRRVYGAISKQPIWKCLDDDLPDIHFPPKTKFKVYPDGEQPSSKS